MLCQTVLPKICGYYLSASIITLGANTRLHPSWPQNKRLYTPWTKDYRHTRQERRIQPELAFTLAKNAIKPNPVEIIPLQTTRKENNWKTEETLARTVVSLKTERIKLVQSFMFMIMMMMMMMMINKLQHHGYQPATHHLVRGLEL